MPRPARPNLLDPAAIPDPYPIYAEMRQAGPVFRSPQFRAHLILGHAEVSAGLKDRRFSAKRADGVIQAIRSEDKNEFANLADAIRRWLLFRDGPEHAQRRRLLMQGFTPRVLGKLRGPIKSSAHELCDRLAAQHAPDAAAHFANPLPVVVIANMLHVPPADHARVFRWSEDLARFFGALSIDAETARSAAQTNTEMFEYMGAIVRRLRSEPGDDFLSALVTAEDDGAVWDDEELCLNLVALLFAGNETTRHLIAHGIHLLLTHPDQRALVRESPDLWPRAVEEVLRFAAPVQMISRVAAEDLELGGQRIRAGQRVFFCLAAANRDPNVFDEPDRFDVTRTENRHVSFGQGSHYCAGAGLARLEAEVALRVLFERFSEIELEPARLKWGLTLILRGFAELGVRL